MFAGAGSVGKTSLMDACKKMAEERGLKVATHYSSTRESYAKAGLTSESDALKDPEFNRNFQHQVMQDNIDRLTKSSHQNHFAMTDLFITDRAPYDYSGYYFAAFKDVLDLAMIEKKRELCDKTMESLANSSTGVHVLMLPYPTSWAVDTESSDGWRADKTGKNFVWSAVVESELADAERRLRHRNKLESPVFFERLPSFMERGPIEARAVGALVRIFPDLR